MTFTTAFLAAALRLYLGTLHSIGSFCQMCVRETTHFCPTTSTKIL